MAYSIISSSRLKKQTFVSDFLLKATNPEITRWNTVQELQKKLNSISPIVISCSAKTSPEPSCKRGQPLGRQDGKTANPGYRMKMGCRGHYHN